MRETEQKETRERELFEIEFLSESIVEEEWNWLADLN